MNKMNFNFSHIKNSRQDIQNLVHTFETGWYVACGDTLWNLGDFLGTAKFYKSYTFEFDETSRYHL